MKCQKEPDLSVGLCRHSLATNEEFAEVPIFRLFCYGKISHLRHFSKRMLFAVLMCFFHNL